MVAENTAVNVILGKVDDLMSKRSVLYAHVSTNADAKTLSIISEFLKNFDISISEYTQAVIRTQKIVARSDKISEAFSHIKGLQNLAQTSSAFTRLPLFKKELDVLIEETKKISKFILESI